MSLYSHRTLILNSTFQPLSVVSFKRAISLMHNKKINAIKNSEIILHSEKEEFYVPKVGILTYFVKAPFARRVALNRENIFIRDYFTCQYCGGIAESVDHIVPRSKGGTDFTKNVVCCCSTCNQHKGHEPWEEWYFSQDFFSEKRYEKIKDWMEPDPPKDLFSYRPRRNNAS